MREGGRRGKGERERERERERGRESTDYARLTGLQMLLI